MAWVNGTPGWCGITSTTTSNLAILGNVTFITDSAPPSYTIRQRLVIHLIACLRAWARV